MAPILTPREAKRYYLWSLWMRPAITYIMMLCTLFLTLTICYLLIEGKALLVDASALIMTIFGTFSPVLTGLVVGKSYERGRGISSENEIMQSVIPPSTPPSTPPANQSSAPVTTPTNPSVTGDADTDAALAALHATDVSGYEPQVATDTPDIENK